MATVRIQLRRGTSSQWDSANPTLAAGEIGIETDTNTFKFGDGVTDWNNLSYALSDTVDDYIPLSLKGVANGVAELDGSGKVPYSQIPSIDELSQDAVNTALVAGTGITKIYNDGANTITVAVDTSVIATKAELAEVSQDSINDALVAGVGLDKTYDDVNNLITIDIDSTVATLTGTQTLTNKTLTSPVINTPTGITKSDVGLSNVDNTSDVDKPVSIATQSALDAKANIASPTFTGTVSGITKSMVGLGNVDNTSDADKPVSTATQSALDLKAPLASPSLTGSPTAPTATAGTNNTQIATTAYVETAVSNLVASAPEALNTLNELAAALGDDANFSSTITTSIGTKVAKAGDTMTGALTLNADPVNSLHAATKQYVDSAETAAEGYADSAISSHNNTTTNIHGIADTSILVTTTGTQTLTGKTISAANNTVTINASDIVDVTASAAELNILDGITATTAELNILDGVTADYLEINKLDGLTSSTAELNILTGVTASPSEINILDGVTASTAEINKLNGLTSSTAELNILTGLTSSTAELNVLDGILASTAELNYVDGVTSAIQTQLDAKAPTASPTFTGTVVLPGTTSIGDVSSTELGYLNNVTSSIQTQLDDKASLTNGATFTGIVVLPNGSSIGDISSTELGYLNGVTSSIQTQLDGKASNTSLSNHESDTTNIHGISDTSVLITTTGTQTLTNKTLTSPKINEDVALTATSTELNYVDGVTSAIQTQLDSKASSTDLSNHASDTTSIHGISDTTQLAYLNAANQTFTGNMEVDGNMTVDGNLTVNGTTFNASSTSIVIEDNMVQLAHQNAANTVDLGLVVAYNDGAAKHAGIVRDVSANKWKLFKGVTSEPATTVDFTQGSLDDLEVAALTATTVTPSSGIVFSDGTQTKEGVPSRTPIVSKSASYTLSLLGERDNLVEFDSASAVTLTVPTNSSVAYPIGTSIDILQVGAGQVTVAGDTGVTVNATPGLKLRAQWSSATLLKRGTNTWVLLGDLSA